MVTKCTKVYSNKKRRKAKCFSQCLADRWCHQSSVSSELPLVKGVLLFVTCVREKKKISLLLLKVYFSVSCSLFPYLNCPIRQTQHDWLHCWQLYLFSVAHWQYAFSIVDFIWFQPILEFSEWRMLGYPIYRLPSRCAWSVFKGLIEHNMKPITSKSHHTNTQRTTNTLKHWHHSLIHTLMQKAAHNECTLETGPTGTARQ